MVYILFHDCHKSITILYKYKNFRTITIAVVYTQAVTELAIAAMHAPHSLSNIVIRPSLSVLVIVQL